jgi:hypothetical protein
MAAGRLLSLEVIDAALDGGKDLVGIDGPLGCALRPRGERRYNC